jgi:hypothetical protein
VDISSIDEAARRWNPKVFKRRDHKENAMFERAYRAEPNLQRAIRRLAFYKANMFNVKEKSTSVPSQKAVPTQVGKSGFQPLKLGAGAAGYGVGMHNGKIISLKYQRPTNGQGKYY